MGSVLFGHKVNVAAMGWGRAQLIALTKESVIGQMIVMDEVAHQLSLLFLKILCLVD